MVSTKIGTTTLKSSSRIPLNKREYAKKRGVTKLVAPQCVAYSTEGKKEFPFSLQKEMRDFASKTYEKAKRSNPCKLGRNPRKKEKLPNRQLLKYVHFIYSTHDSLILVRIRVYILIFAIVLYIVITSFFLY